jgi:hypothetical protein
MRFFVLFVLLLAGCVDPAAGAMQNQSLGRATGWFAQLHADNVLCTLQAIGTPTIDLSFYLGPDTELDLTTLRFRPLAHRDQRFQQLTSMAYGFGDAVGGAAELERGAAIVDPRFTDEARASAIASHTSLYFPLTVHRLRLNAGHLCNGDLSSGATITTDCIDVVEGSGLDEAHLWCDVAGEVDPKWTE